MKRVNVGAELRALQRMTAGELREKYLAVFGEPTSGVANSKRLRG